jgi:hypothetical protein
MKNLSMKWTENFNSHRVEDGKEKAVFYYIDITNTHPIIQEPKDNEIKTQTLEPKKLTINLENKVFRSIVSEEQIQDLKKLNIDAIEQTKKSLIQERDSNTEAELFNHTLSLSETKDYRQTVKGIKAWIYSLFGYRPLIWIESDEFLYLILKSSNEIAEKSRMGPGNWVIVHPECSGRFIKTNDWRYKKSNDNIISNVNYLGQWKNISVYTSGLIDKNQILIGRKAFNKNDNLVSSAMGEEKWSKTEKAAGKPYQWFCEISLERQSKVFNPPGSGKSYQNWRFECNKPNIWKWFGKNLVKLLNYVANRYT